MTATVGTLARDAVRTLPLYDPDAAACAIDLSDNTNLWGMAPAAQRALREAPTATLSRYPSLYSGPLRDAVLAYLGGAVAAAGPGVVTGCGSDDVLDSAMRAFGHPGGRIAFSAPTFSMIPVFAQLNGLEPVAIPLTDRFDVDAERLVACDAAITYLCTPNNPTATSLSREAVEYVVRHARGVVLVDEAYAEFAPEQFMDLAATHDRVLVVRTFSKAFGLAGLRVGYGVGSDELTGLIERARGPYKVNALAERAALASLAEGQDAAGWVRRHAALAVELRERFATALSAIGLPPLPSAANFLFVPTAQARTIGAAARARGVLLRAMSGLPRDLAVLDAAAGCALRIGIGPWDMMARVLDVLREVTA